MFHKINPDGSLEKLDSIPPTPPSNPWVVLRAAELYRLHPGNHEKVMEILKKEAGEGKFPTDRLPENPVNSGPPPGYAESKPAEPAPQPDDDEEEKARERWLYHRYLQAYVRLAAGQVEDLGVGSMEDIAAVAKTPATSFDQWRSKLGE